MALVRRSVWKADVCCVMEWKCKVQRKEGNSRKWQGSCGLCARALAGSGIAVISWRGEVKFRALLHRREPSRLRMQRRVSWIELSLWCRELPPGSQPTKGS